MLDNRAELDHWSRTSHHGLTTREASSVAENKEGRLLCLDKIDEMQGTEEMRASLESGRGTWTERDDKKQCVAGMRVLRLISLTCLLWKLACGLRISGGD